MRSVLRRPSAPRRGPTALSQAAALALGAGSICAAGACHPASSAVAPEPQAWGAALQGALRAGDDAACGAMVPTDAGAICARLGGLSDPGLTVSVTGDDVRIAWAVGGRRSAHHLVARWERHGATTVATSLGPATGAQVPQWWREDIPVAESGSVTALGACPQGVAARADEAWRQVVAADLGPLLVDPAPPLILACPRSPATFHALLATGFGADQATAAAAWPIGDDANRTVQVVLRPGTQPGDELEALLRHEIVHVVTAAYQARALWLAEGLADAIALDPAQREMGDALVREDVAARGAPLDLPADADFRGPADRLELTYAYARRAVEVLRARLGWDQAREVIAAWSRGDESPILARDQLVAWWREDLSA